MTRCVDRNARMDRLDAFDVEDIAGRRPRELVRAVRRADRDRERIDAGFRDEIGGLIGIGQQLRMIEHAFGAEPSSSPAVPVSSEPRQPSSPSTDTPTACAMSTTRRVTVTLYS